MPNNEQVVQRLLRLVRELYDSTAGWQGDENALQGWYDRGYANGMIRVFQELGFSERLHQLVDPDPQDLLQGQEFLPWGKAYSHGFEMGEKETRSALAEN